MKALIITLILTAVFGSKTVAQSKISIDPNITYQTVEGWGGSLSWWANIMGAHPDEKIDIMIDWIVNPSHLNMNLFRFNIGAGDTPEHDHMRKDGGAMPSYKLTALGDYDWTQDENQRNILQKLLKRRYELLQEQDIKLVAFSTSPPWWMTKSGCSSGATTKSTNNLKEDMYDDFADYLTDVVKYYHDSLGIIFSYLEPMNEPDGGWWVAEGNQEGCYFTIEKQEKLLVEVHAALERKNMLSYCQLAGSDWNNINNGVTALNSYISNGYVMDKLSHIDCHSYSGNNTGRQQLAAIAKQYDKSLWQSESGPLNIGVSDNFQIMHIAQRIITDMRLMKPDAWIDWQLLTNGSKQWGLIDGKYNNPQARCEKFISFYIRSQYSRFIKPGYKIINSNGNNTLAAISPHNDELVLVICNTDTSGTPSTYDIDLSLFELSADIPYKYITTVDGEYKTKGSFITIKNNALIYSSPLQSVTTFIIPINETYEKPVAEDEVLSDFETGIGIFSDISFHSSFEGTFPNDPDPHATWHIIYDSIAENPLQELNTSKNTYLVEQENADWWGNFLNFKITDEAQGIVINDNNRYLHVYHYRGTILDGWSLYINSKVNCNNVGNTRRFNGNNAKVNTWEDLVFDLEYLIQEEATLDLFTFCLNTDYTSPKTHPMSIFAFDQIVLNNSAVPRHLGSNISSEILEDKSIIKYSYRNRNLTLWTEEQIPISYVKIYTISGQCIVSQEVNDNSFSHEILQPGFYIVSVNNSLYQKKLSLF